MYVVRFYRVLLMFLNIIGDIGVGWVSVLGGVLMYCCNGCICDYGMFVCSRLFVLVFRLIKVLV